RFRPTEAEGIAYYNFQVARLNPGHTDVISDDAVLIHTQYSTQWDSFAHVGQMFDADGDGQPECVYYNGFRRGTHILPPLDDRGRGMGARRLGIETMAVKAMHSRGVLVDLFQLAGPERSFIGYDGLMQAIEADSVE